MSGTVRQQKYGKLIQKELSEIFQRDKRGILDNAFISIAEVRMSPDLAIAKVYISMMLAKNKQAILERLRVLRSQGLAYDKIAYQLNAEGLGPRSAKKWYPGVVRRLLIVQRQTGAQLLGKLAGV